MEAGVEGTVRVEPGLPYPLGVFWTGRGANVALFSANAERVDLSVFDASGRRETARLRLPERTEDVWHGFLPDARPGMLYGFRVYGPYDPGGGHRFNHHKLLLDPHARALSGRLVWNDAHFGYRVGHPKGDLSFDRRDNARFMPKCVLVEPGGRRGREAPPRIPWSRTLIYEAHVKGQTFLDPAVPGPLRGTFAGLAAPGAIERLRRLGVTTLELLPVQAFLDDRHLVARGLSNYWGYSPLCYFAPEPRYGGEDAVHQFRIMVAELHDAGIEVILDVVYNHTGEGNEFGPTLSFRGVDNASYYRLQAGNPRHYVDHTGCGNSLDLRHPRVLQMVLDSLRHWVEAMGVDGFRFDLAPVLGRREHGFDPDAAFFHALAQDPVLCRVKRIAEPWDLGPDGYRLGGFPAGWSEWNDRFRRDVRRFWRGDSGMVGPLAARLAGSADIFSEARRRPSASVNYVTCHDGFTLADLVSHARKHNDANGEGNRDGPDENHGANWGVEGPTDDQGILSLRRRMARNLLATLFTAQGVPMVLGGDEVLRSQGGNNNAYAQDAPLSWTDWTPRPEAHAMTQFVAALSGLRRLHGALSQDVFLHGLGTSGGVKDLAWFRRDGAEMRPEDWHDPGNRFLAMLLGGTPRDVAPPLLALFHAGSESVEATLPAPGRWRNWRVEVDTALESGIDGVRRIAGARCIAMPPRAFLLLVGEGVA